MKICIPGTIILCIAIFAIGFFYFFIVSIASAEQFGTVEITVKILVCGNNIKETGEECDGTDLAGQSCTSKGYAGGTLSCNSDCTFNTSQCTSAPPGGGGGGAYIPPAPETKVIFSGRAYPGSKVTLLKDGQVAASVLADPNAAFNISLSGLSSGNYIFSIYSEDSAGRRSPLLNYPITVTSGVTIQMTGIFIAPTIDVDKSEVKRGDNIAIFGQSVPQGEITIVVSSEQDFFGKTKADKDGIYLYNFDTTPVEMGQHFTKSKSAKDGEISSFGQAVSFLVGTKNVAKAVPAVCGKADLNCDGRVNLVDFSIAAYWYKRIISAEFAIKEKERLNGDGKVDLVDFSIMAYYWTG